MASSCNADNKCLSITSCGITNLYQTSGGATLDNELEITTKISTANGNATT